MGTRGGIMDSILDSNEKEPTLYFCDDEKVLLKPVVSQKALSARELEIIELLVKGLISKEITEVLNISKNTVENHKQNIYNWRCRFNGFLSKNRCNLCIT